MPPSRSEGVLIGILAGMFTIVALVGLLGLLLYLDPPWLGDWYCFMFLFVPLSVALAARASWKSGVARYRYVSGLCPRCGYDLRATPSRCPECGYDVFN